MSEERQAWRYKWQKFEVTCLHCGKPLLHGDFFDRRHKHGLHNKCRIPYAEHHKAMGSDFLSNPGNFMADKTPIVASKSLVNKMVEKARREEQRRRNQVIMRQRERQD